MLCSVFEGLYISNMLLNSLLIRPWGKKRPTRHKHMGGIVPGSRGDQNHCLYFSQTISFGESLESPWTMPRLGESF